MTFLRMWRRSRSVEAVKVPSRAYFPVDNALIDRQEAAAAELGENSVKPILLEEQPDGFVTPIDYEDLPA